MKFVVSFIRNGEQFEVMYECETSIDALMESKLEYNWNAASVRPLREEEAH